MITQGTIFSLLPTAVQLFYVFPFQTQQGFGGVSLGIYTPLFVIFFNWVWGVTAAVAIRIAK